MEKPAWVSQELWDDEESMRLIAGAIMDADIAEKLKRMDAQFFPPAVVEMLAHIDEAQN